MHFKLPKTYITPEEHGGLHRCVETKKLGTIGWWHLVLLRSSARRYDYLFELLR